MIDESVRFLGIPRSRSSRAIFVVRPLLLCVPFKPGDGGGGGGESRISVCCFFLTKFVCERYDPPKLTPCPLWVMTSAGWQKIVAALAFSPLRIAISVNVSRDGLHHRYRQRGFHSTKHTRQIPCWKMTALIVLRFLVVFWAWLRHWNNACGGSRQP